MVVAALGAGTYLCGALPAVRRRTIRRTPDGSLFHVERVKVWCGWSALAIIMATLALACIWEESPQRASATVVLTPVFLALVLVDATTLTLPNNLTGSAIAATAFGLLTDPGGLARGCAGAFTLTGLYFLLVVVSGGSGMGLGDVKLAPTVGALGAWAGWSHWCVVATVPAVLAGIWGGVLLARGAGKTARMPFGPFMLFGLWVALLT